MVKLEGVGKLRFDLIPQAPHTKILVAWADIVQEHKAAGLHFRQPVAKIVRHGIVSMQSVDMEKTDRSICELGQRIVKASPQQIRKLPIKAVVILADLFKNFFAVMAGMLIPEPVVYRVTKAIEAMFLHGLAK